MRDILRRNLGYKIVSLVLAIIFWMWITSQADTTLFAKNNISVPLVIKNQPSNLVIISNYIPEITVQIDNSQGVSVEDLLPFVDLTNATAGQHSFQVFMDPPEGVTLESISPQSVVLKLDLVQDKIVPVTAAISGAPEKGFTAGKPVITPSYVNVRGPASILDKLENVVVDVNVTGLKESKRIPWPVTFKDIKGEGIFAPDPNLESLNAFPGTVEVLIPIYPSDLAGKFVPLQVSTRGEPAAGMMVRLVSAVPAGVELTGDAETLKGIEKIILGAVDISGISADKAFDISLNSVALPNGVSFVEGTKISVMVYVRQSPTDKTIVGIPVEIRNLTQGLSAVPIPAIDITLNAYPEILNNLKTGDIKAWVDATGLQEGTYKETDVFWSVPTGVSVVKVPDVELVINKQ